VELAVALIQSSGRRDFIPPPRLPASKFPKAKAAKGKPCVPGN
jgi:hypothetical protein